MNLKKHQIQYLCTWIIPCNVSESENHIVDRSTRHIYEHFGQVVRYKSGLNAQKKMPVNIWIFLASMRKDQLGSMQKD